MTIVLKPLASAGPLHISTQGFPLTTVTSSELPSQSAHIHIRQASTPLASSPPSSSVPQSPNHSISSHLNEIISTVEMCRDSALDSREMF
ncbi:hypothetical protein WR25_20807 [Diploscapter pachys]|uniref:Uncharacterized protein n=1 Tax=Diploscapter pachys TaxID=2018661 RepID=A0A2A2LDU3_9BILA|nr:hypothetical protein WR25_20807 [Diploscapter pachys]